jgi:hypothetical protein
MMKRIIPAALLHDEITSVALSASKLIEDYRHGVIDVITTGFTGTIKVKVSNQDTEPDFSDSSTPTNLWTYADLKGRDDGGATVVGATGIVDTADTSVRSFAINTDAVRWAAVDVEAQSAGSVSVLISGATNE